MNEDQIRELFISQHGKPSDCHRLTIKKSQKGNWVCRLYYQRSSWVDSNLERTVVYNEFGQTIETK